MKPEVSVVIPTYNRAQPLERAIRSVLAQTYRLYELIIVDDGSTDETDVIISKFSNVQVLKTENHGVSHARNLGIEKAKGDWIAFLDSDDEWLPKKLELQMDFLANHPEFRIAQTEEIWIRNGKRVNPMKKHQKHSGLIFKECLPLCIVSPSAVIIQKSLLSEVGTFDESFPACEDYDLWLRIAAKHPIGLLATPLIIKYGGHEDQLSRRTPNLDAYRIRAMKKLLDSGTLNSEQTEWALQELQKKCRVYANGCEKRGKFSEAKEYRLIPSSPHDAEQHHK